MPRFAAAPGFVVAPPFVAVPRVPVAAAFLRVPAMADAAPSHARRAARRCNVPATARESVPRDSRYKPFGR
jgi:hypothetical protein